MAYSIGIASGLLSGLSGLPRGMQQASEEEMARERLGLGQQQIDLQRDIQNRLAKQFEESKYLEVPTPAIPAGYGTPGLGGTTRIRTELLPTLSQMRGDEMRQERESKQGAALALALKPLAERNPELKPLIDALGTGAGAQTIAPLFEKVAGAEQARQDRLTNQRLMAGALAQANPDLARQLFPEAFTPPPPATPARIMPTGGEPSPSVPLAQQPTVQAAGGDLGAAIANLATQAQGLPGVPAPTTKPVESRPAYRPPTLAFGGKEGLRVTMNPTPEPTIAPEYLKAEQALQALEDAGVPETDPRYIRAAKHLDRLKPMAVQEGGGIGGPSGQPTIRSPLPARTPEGRLKDFEAIDLAQGQLNEMLRLAPTVQLPQIAGGLAPWVNSIIQTGKVGPIPIPEAIRGTLSDDQNRFLALLLDYADQVLRLRSGAQINEQEFRRMLGFLASPDVTPQVIVQRLMLQQDFLKAKRGAMENALRSGGYRVPGASVPSLAPQQGAAPPLVPEVPAQPAPQPGLLQRALPFLFGGGGSQGKVRVRAPDGKTGTWDLSKGPVPPGYQRLE